VPRAGRDRPHPHGGVPARFPQRVQQGCLFARGDRKEQAPARLGVERGQLAALRHGSRDRNAGREIAPVVPPPARDVALEAQLLHAIEERKRIRFEDERRPAGIRQLHGVSDESETGHVGGRARARF